MISFKKLRSFLFIITAAAALAFSPIWEAQAYALEKIPVKVAVLALFETSEDPAQFSAEFAHWYRNHFADAKSYAVPGAYFKLYEKDGFAGTILGMGKASAAASVTALLNDGRFDWSQTYFIVSGCGGASPKRAATGSVCIADWVVDGELGQSIRGADTSDGRDLFIKMDGSDYSVLKLNDKLVKWALFEASRVQLADSEKAAAYRKNYREDAANRKPFVYSGASLTGDAYWHGEAAARYYGSVPAQLGAGEYGATQMEDSGVALALKRAGHEDRFLVYRDIVNFDRQYPGITAQQSLKSNSGGFSIGMENGYRAALPMVMEILRHWDEWKDGVPDFHK